eukprot:SAG31_NODE_7_length_42755_cov_130.245728_31_plen_113_part_00
MLSFETEKPCCRHETGRVTIICCAFSAPQCPGSSPGQRLVPSAQKLDSSAIIRSQQCKSSVENFGSIDKDPPMSLKLKSIVEETLGNEVVEMSISALVVDSIHEDTLDIMCL